LIDFHNHLLARVDDGSSSAEQSRAAVGAMHEQGVRGIVVTPHLLASITRRPDALAQALEELDDAYDELAAIVASDFPDVRLARGVELMLDAPAPDLSDPRLRLDGTRFALLEFPWMRVPPHSARALHALRERGWTPVVAHPERYHNFDGVGVVDEWRSVGAFVQCNAGSVTGRYGPRAQEKAWDLLAAGRVDYLCSDYHARERLPIDAARAAFEGAGGADRFDLLTCANPARLLAGEDPLPVPPLARRRSVWSRLLRGRAT
jgi:protein-tyrosine phosphatase